MIAMPFRPVLIVSLLISFWSLNAEAKNDRKEPVPQTPPAAAPVGAEAMDAELVRVNGKPLKTRDYAGFLQRNQAYVQSAMASDAGKVLAIRAMVGGVLIREVMMKEPGLLPSGEKSTPQELSAAYEKIAERHFPIPETPGEKELMDYYQSHLDDYGIPELIRVSQIQFSVPEKAGDGVKKAARMKAETALKKVKEGEDFSKVAEEMTENKLAKLPKGDLGFLRVRGDEWLRTAVKGFKIGQVSEILESPAGYEILKVTDTRAAITSPFLNVRDQIIQAMKTEIQTQERDQYIETLAAAAKIEVVQPELKALFPRGVFPKP